jgi:hypothetical protein
VAERGQKTLAEVGEPLGRSGAGQRGSCTGRIQRGLRWLPVLSSEGKWGGEQGPNARGVLRKEGRVGAGRASDGCELEAIWRARWRGPGATGTAEQSSRREWRTTVVVKGGGGVRPRRETGEGPT